MIFYVFNRSFNAFFPLTYSKVLPYIKPWFACQIPLYYSRFMVEQAHLTRLQIACEFRSYLQRDFNKMASSVKKQIWKYSHNFVILISDIRISTCCKISIWNLDNFDTFIWKIVRHTIMLFAIVFSHEVTNLYIIYEEVIFNEHN